ncbi:hydrolase, putative [Citrifermentans bemidjiense Bem]|uniref:Hydrolase, putative n=1 Tax=Citrifermentans bemidjiense (strain ATCC BAA-1014 / DSM 16622 / JCM 12645 / Bem) TaxID=404380 RepID=B5EAI3_CITBB|nr:alpha/beta fold hydrolase [Citrifermentans bemidjiense]ACH40322.1 hydrolase, putative [Citrifermentans bemidjiense Bem]
MLRIAVLLLVALLALILVAATWQRRLLFFPTHESGNNGLSEWRHGQELIGFAREVPAPLNVWLMLHGNGGQASDRAYALPSFSRNDSVFILEYPGYGARPGEPSRASLDAAARQAYRLLRERFPRTPVCVLGESLGSGPASVLSGEHPPPDKIVLVAPFDQLHRVAAYHYPFLPVRLLLSDDWDNVQSLRGYGGRVEIFGMRDDEVIPDRFAKALADSKQGALFREIEGGHNDWAAGGEVAIRNP